MLVLYPYNPNLITVEVIPTFEIVDAPPPVKQPNVSWVDMLREYLSDHNVLEERK